MSGYTIGIDSGTQSVKALVVRHDGEVIGRGQHPHRMIEGLGVGHKEQHPAEWIDAAAVAIRDSLAHAGIAGDEVRAIGVSGQQHGFVPLDAKGDVIRPAKLWCDTSTAAEAEEIMQACGGREAFQKLTGNALPPGFTASKILWLKKHEPENFARLDRVLLPHDFLNFWLTGRTTMEWGDASGTGLMDVRSRAWASEALNAIDPALGRKLPHLQPSSEPAGAVQPAVAEKLGITPGALVSAGGGDNMMGAIGTGNVVPGIVTVSLGTSGTIYACSPAPVIDPGGEIAAFCDSAGNWLPLLCTMNVTVATELARKTFEMGTEELNRAAASISPGAEGLMLLPYFEGERVPNVPEGTGAWIGYREGTHTPAHFARAAMEGAVLGMNYGMNRLRKLGVSGTEIRLTGGGSKSPLWRQIVADVFGTPVVCCKEAEGAAFGAALQARWAIARSEDPRAEIAPIATQWVRVDSSTRCEPNRDTRALYESMQTLHDSLSVSLRDVFSQHRRVAW